MDIDQVLARIPMYGWYYTTFASSLGEDDEPVIFHCIIHKNTVRNFAEKTVPEIMRIVPADSDQQLPLNRLPEIAAGMLKLQPDGQHILVFVKEESGTLTDPDQIDGHLEGMQGCFTENGQRFAHIIFSDILFDFVFTDLEFTSAAN